MPIFMPPIGGALVTAQAALAAAQVANIATMATRRAGGGTLQSAPGQKWAVRYQTVGGPILSAPVDAREEAEDIASGSSPQLCPRVVCLGSDAPNCYKRTEPGERWWIGLGARKIIAWLNERDAQTESDRRRG